MWLAFLACDPSARQKTGQDTAAEVADSVGDSTKPGDDSDAGEDSEVPAGDMVCPDPGACISLAEAYDKGDAEISLTQQMSIRIQNIGQNTVCLDEWYTFLGSGTQDGIAGLPAAVALQAGEYADLYYGQDVYAPGYADPGGGWWCIEHNQYTVGGEIFEFIGAEAPPSLMDIVVPRADSDMDGVEDHADGDDGDPQTLEQGSLTQEAIWDRVEYEPVVIVGRKTNYLAMAVGQVGTITIEAINIGRVFTYGKIIEVIPAGITASNFSVEPILVEPLGDGSTRYTWAAKLEGALNGGGSYEPSTYFPAEITYEVRIEACAGRVVGEKPGVVWESEGEEWEGWGSELVVECCAE